MSSTSPESAHVKSCCAAAYERDAVALVLGPSFHPGGRTLTRRLADRLGLRPGQRVLDVASGPGTTALLLAAEYGVRVDGVDFSADLVASATASANVADLGSHAVFHVGDAEHLPFEDAVFDAVICECAFCTFPDKSAAAAEFARVLRPGGQLGITDVTVRRGDLPAALDDLAGTIACLADARSLDDYAAILAAAGFHVTHTEDHRQALTAMVDQIQARLKVLGMVRPRHPALDDVDLPRILELTQVAAEAIHQDVASYALLVAATSLS